MLDFPLLCCCWLLLVVVFLRCWQGDRLVGRKSLQTPPNWRSHHFLPNLSQLPHLPCYSGVFGQLLHNILLSNPQLSYWALRPRGIDPHVANLHSLPRLLRELSESIDAIVVITCQHQPASPLELIPLPNQPRGTCGVGGEDDRIFLGVSVEVLQYSLASLLDGDGGGFGCWVD